MMHWLYFLKLLRAFPRLSRISPSPWSLLWRVLRGQTAHILLLPDGKPLQRRITPPNLYGFLRLREAGIALAAEQPASADQLLWELAPGRTFLTRLTVGMDLMTLYEVFGRKDYGSDFSGQVVVDVGAYNGDSAVFFALAGARRVIAFEPYPPNFELAAENVRRMGLSDRVTLLPVALGAQRGKAQLQVAAQEPDANTLTLAGSPLQKLIAFTQTVEVEVWSFEDLLAQVGQEEIDFLKLDCEGCEFALIETLPVEALRRVKVWHIEYHAAPHPLVHKLEAAGFSVERQLDRRFLGYLVARR
ncbi:MAG: hypothetical protein KatS3mg026_0100 [Bacteroidia bacterium]|nr:MAG: hypothetical protein KatS3mg026_0100 [Bacteroidia bacterium]